MSQSAITVPLNPWGQWWRWLPFAGLAALYVPTFLTAAGSLWDTDENGHGPLILMVICWMFWDCRGKLEKIEGQSAPVAGWGSLVFGLLVYVVGRSQSIWLLDMGSLIPVIAGALLVTYGWQAVRRLWFPILFIAFLVPLPGPLVDAITGPLKQGISMAAESLLYLFGYPIARTGVILSIGQYQLLVADACSGLNSIFSLSALGTLYLYIAGHGSRLRNFVIVSCIVPIAVLANLIRVITLVLITYKYGDAAGQGFLHGFAGMVLFVAALLLLLGLDAAWGLGERIMHRRNVGLPLSGTGP